MAKNTPLKSAIHRILLYRLFLTVLGLSLFFAGISYYHSKNMIMQAIIQASTTQVNVIRGRFNELMKRPEANIESALQDAVNYPPDLEFHIKEGEFVYALLHSENRINIGIYEHKKFSAVTQIKNYLDKLPEKYPQYGEQEYKPITIDEQSYLDIHSKIFERDDGSAIFLRAIFALSDQAIHSVHQQAIQIVFYVIGLVIATALLLYPVITHLMNRLADSSTGLLTAHLQTMEALGTAIAKRDSDTDIHNYRVTIYAVSLGEQLGMDELQIQRLIKGAFLHDVGKIGISDNILLNKAKLDENEFKIMQGHVQHGIDIIKESSWLKDSIDVVSFHHEKYDGSGYPNGIKANDIPLNARVFAIVDVFDALTSKRPYKEPYTYEQTMEIMVQGSSSHFDPGLLEIFKGISQNLYAEYSGREDNGLKSKLQDITDKYFHSGIDTLLY